MLLQFSDKPSVGSCKGQLKYLVVKRLGSSSCYILTLVIRSALGFFFYLSWESTSSSLSPLLKCVVSRASWGPASEQNNCSVPYCNCYAPIASLWVFTMRRNVFYVLVLSPVMFMCLFNGTSSIVESFKKLYLTSFKYYMTIWLH